MARRLLAAAMLSTALCDLLGIRAPIIQAPITASPRLAAAVGDAGGLGMLGLTWTPAEQIGALIERTRQLGDGRFGANLVIAEPQFERLDAILAAGTPLVSLFWGDPAPYIDAIHAAGALAAFTVGSADEARAAVGAGADVIVAQGWEAGGHVWGQVATLPLVPAVVDACDATPVVAAGGVCDGRTLAAVLSLGAAGAWVGTRFIASVEGPFHDYYKDRVIAASETSTARTTAFYLGWPDAPHRVLRNSTVERFEARGQTTPEPTEVVARTGTGEPLLRHSFWEPAAGTTGDLEALALYAGQSAGLIRDVRPVAAIIADLMAGAEASLHAAAEVARGGDDLGQ